MAENGNGGTFLQKWMPTIAAGLVVFVAVVQYGSNQGSSGSNLSTLQNQYNDLKQRVTTNEQNYQSLLVVVTGQGKSDCQQFAKTEGQIVSAVEILNETHVSNLRFQDDVKQKLWGITPSGKYHELNIEHSVQPC